MNEAGMDRTQKCPQCGATLPAGALAGLCPACLLQQGAAADTATRPNAKPFVPPTVAEVARLFPQLEILGFLGKGGMGAVYKARQPALDRFVALKILPAQAAPDAGFAERFTREARALARLSHPNIVAVHEFGQVSASGAGETPALPYFIMEFVDGVNLRQLEKSGRLSPREALQIVPQICDALQYAHDEGVVHRDIKPENVLVDRKGRVKIADFGLAKILGHDPEALRLTGEGQVMGTPHYMAPEQVEHPLAVDHRADIFSLGVVFYEMLTGELPLGKFQPPSRKVQVDVRLDEVVLHALEKEPERRYQQASQVKTDVETIMGPAPPKGSLPGPPPPMMPTGDRRKGKRSKVALITTGAAALLVGLGVLLMALDRWATRGMPRPGGLVSWWPGENSTADVVGTNNGTVAGYGTFCYGPGVVGQAFVFDGIHRDRVDVGNPASLRLQEFTIEAWIKRSSSTDISLDDNGNDDSLGGGGAVVFGYGRGGYGFGLLNDGALLLSRIDLDGIHSGNAVSDTDWHHVAVTKSGSTAMFFIDGVPASAPIAYTTTYTFDTSAAIGSRGDAGGGTFFGMIDEPSVYSRALSSSEIQAIFTAGQNGKRKPGQGLFAMFRAAEHRPGPDHSRSIKPGGPFVASLPQGNVELVAVSRHPSANAPWWKPDGSPAREGPFDQRVILDANGGLAREFVIRLAGLPENASDPAWDFDPAPVGVCAGGQPSQAAGLRQAAVVYQNAVQTTTVKLGFGWGAWDTLASEGPAPTSPSQTFSESRQGHSWQVSFSPPTEKEGSAVVTVSHSVKEWETRVAAVDKDGREHLSTGGGSAGDAFHQWDAKFDQLPLAEVKEFKFQVRPYRWVEFRNVSLQPGRQTQVEIVDARDKRHGD